MQDFISKYISNKPEKLIFFLLLLVAISYSNSIYSPFTLDDSHSFLNNSAVYVDTISFDSLKKLSSSVFGVGRVIPMITFAFDHYVFSITNSIAQYHFTNIIIHLLATSAVYFLLTTILSLKSLSDELRFFNIKYFALITTALWALSPVQTNAVTYIVQRMASLCALFFFMAIACYIRARTLKSRSVFLYWLLFIVFSTFSFLSKENSAILPLIILLIEYTFISQKKINTWIRSLNYKYILMLLVLMLVGFLMFWPTIYGQLHGYGFRNFNLVERLLTESRVIIFYISLIILPLTSRLNLEHDFQVSTGIFDPANTILSILFLSGLALYGIWKISSNKLISFGILFFFITNLIESTVIPLELVFEHRLYLPSIGLIISMVILLDSILARFTNKTKDTYLLVGVFSLIVCSLLSIATTLRNNTWRDANSFSIDMYSKSPNKLRVISEYSKTLYDQGNKDKAIELLEHCIDTSTPTNDVLGTCTTNLMGIYISNDKLDEAIDLFKKVNAKGLSRYNAISTGSIILNLGYALYKKDDLDGAIETSKLALLMPNSDFVATRIVNNLALYKYKKTCEELFPEKNCNEISGDDSPEILDIVFIDEIKNLISIRKYDKALERINSYKNIPDEAKELESEIIDMIEKNKLHAKQYKVINYINHKSISYKIITVCSDFIFRYYNKSFPVIDKIINSEISKDDNDLFLKYLLSKSLLLQGKTDLAETISEEFLSQNNDFAPIFNLLIKIKSRLGKKTELLMLCKRILDIYPGHPRWIAYKYVINNNS